MVGIAISVLWFLIGLIVLCGIIYLAIWVIESFVTPIPEQIKKGVWVIVLLLALIALLTMLVGGGSFPRLGARADLVIAALPLTSAGYLRELLT
jgi:hypothetical protein